MAEAHLTYQIPENPALVVPYDGSIKFEPNDLTDLIPTGAMPNIVFGADALEKNKSISKLVMRSIALQASIDSQIAILLAEIAKTHAEIVSAMFSEIRNASARRAVFTSAAQVANLSENQKKVLFGLISLSERTATKRNHFAHHLWGVVAGFEDYLLLLNPAHYSSANASIQQKHSRGGIVSAEDGIARTKFLISKSKMYSKENLEGLIEEQIYIYDKLKELEILFQAPTDVKRIAFDALIYEPRILSIQQSRTEKRVRRNKPKVPKR